MMTIRLENGTTYTPKDTDLHDVTTTLAELADIHRLSLEKGLDVSADLQWTCRACWPNETKWN